MKALWVFVLKEIMMNCGLIYLTQKIETIMLTHWVRLPLPGIMLWNDMLWNMQICTFLLSKNQEYYWSLVIFSTINEKVMDILNLSIFLILLIILASVFFICFYRDKVLKPYLGLAIFRGLNLGHEYSLPL